jgi:hypothetical protein
MNETVCCAARNTMLGEVKVVGSPLCLFHEPGPILRFKQNSSKMPLKPRMQQLTILFS